MLIATYAQPLKCGSNPKVPQAEWIYELQYSHTLEQLRKQTAATSYMKLNCIM